MTTDETFTDQLEHWLRADETRTLGSLGEVFAEKSFAVTILLLIGLAASAFVAPPFSGLDTLPAMGAVAIALSIILEDVVVLAVGVVIGTGGALVILTIGAAVARFVRDLF